MKSEKCYGAGMLYVFLFIGVGAGFISGTAIYAFMYPAFQSTAWAAWVQAIGSIGAILVAIYVVRLQHEKVVERALSDQREAEKRLIKALGTELALEWNQYVDSAGRHIAKMSDGSALCYKWAPPAAPFPIYRSSAGKVGLISDPKTGQNLITAFSHVERLYLAYREINCCLDGLVALNESIAKKEPDAQKLRALAKERLGSATNVVRQAHHRARDSVTRAHTDILQTLGRDMLGIALLDDRRDQFT